MTTQTCIFSLSIVLMMASCTFAGFVNGDFSAPIIEAQQWSATNDSLGVWYGADYAVDDGFAANTATVHSTSYNAVRSLIQVIDIPDADTYNWSLDTKLSNYDNQWCYWQVYLLKDDAVVDLVGGPEWQENFTSAESISSDYLRDGQDDEEWHSVTDQFTITQDDITAYDYLAIILTSSVYNDGQLTGFDNVSSNIPASGSGQVPEPATLCFLAIGGVLTLVRKKRAIA